MHQFAQALIFVATYFTQRMKAKSIDDYISRFGPEVRERLQTVRRIVRKHFPSAEETIKYNMPTFVLEGGNLVHFAAFSAHIGFFPAPTDDLAFASRLAGYRTGKGSVQFPYTESLPEELVADMLHWRAARLRGSHRSKAKQKK